MSLHNWPPRRIAILWIVILAGYWGLLIYARSSQRPVEATAPRITGDAVTLARWDSALAVTFVLMRETSHWPQASRDTLLATLTADSHARDSVLRALNVPGQLNAAQRDSLQAMMQPLVLPFLAALGQVSDEFSRAILVGLAIWLGPAIALLALTIAWMVRRRRTKAASSRAAA